LIAKENVVGTFGILYGFAEVAEDGAEIWSALTASFTTLAAYSFLVFNLLCAPCFAAMGVIKREMNNAKWFWAAIGYQCGLAYIVSLCIYQFGMMLSGRFGFGTFIAFLLTAGFLLCCSVRRHGSTKKSSRKGAEALRKKRNLQTMCLTLRLCKRKRKKEIVCF
jgi:ferrous iron transport protein B